MKSVPIIVSQFIFTKDRAKCILHRKQTRRAELMMRACIPSPRSPPMPTISDKCKDYNVYTYTRWDEMRWDVFATARHPLSFTRIAMIRDELNEKQSVSLAVLSLIPEAFYLILLVSFLLKRIQPSLLSHTLFVSRKGHWSRGHPTNRCAYFFSPRWYSLLIRDPLIYTWNSSGTRCHEMIVSLI